MDTVSHELFTNHFEIECLHVGVLYQLEPLEVTIVLFRVVILLKVNYLVFICKIYLGYKLGDFTVSLIGELLLI